MALSIAGSATPFPGTIYPSSNSTEKYQRRSLPDPFDVGSILNPPILNPFADWSKDDPVKNPTRWKNRQQRRRKLKKPRKSGTGNVHPEVDLFSAVSNFFDFDNLASSAAAIFQGQDEQEDQGEKDFIGGATSEHQHDRKGYGDDDDGGEQPAVVFFPNNQDSECMDGQVGGGFNTFGFLSMLIAGFNLMNIVSNNINNRNNNNNNNKNENNDNNNQINEANNKGDITNNNMIIMPSVPGRSIKEGARPTIIMKKKKKRSSDANIWERNEILRDILTGRNLQSVFNKISQRDAISDDVLDDDVNGDNVNDERKELAAEEGRFKNAKFQRRSKTRLELTFSATNGHAVPNCSGFKSGVPDISLSDILLAFLRFEIAADDDGTRSEADCFKRILCEMNSVVANRNEGGAELGNLFSEFGTFAVLQNQNVLAPSESLLRAARTGRLLAGPGKCSRIYDSCSRWEELTNKAELLWLQKSK